MIDRSARCACVLLAAVCSVLAGCQRSAEPLLGTLEWDRATVQAEAAEPVLRIDVAEGDRVQAGQVLLQLDARRTQASLDGADAEWRRSRASLAELQHGARPETVEASRAALQRAETTQANAERERQRVAALARDNIVSPQALDTAETALHTARADADNRRAQLQELLHGTRVEQLDQAQAAVDSADASRRRLQLTLDRLTVRAPRDGRIDALPFRLGDQPPAGAVVASLLVGEAPYARVFVPASRRAALDAKTVYRVHVAGVPQAYEAQLRSIRSRPDFTPYYALTGADASRLSYRAELLLRGDVAALAAGLPVTVDAAP